MILYRDLSLVRNQSWKYSKDIPLTLMTIQLLQSSQYVVKERMQAWKTTDVH